MKVPFCSLRARPRALDLGSNGVIEGPERDLGGALTLATDGFVGVGLTGSHDLHAGRRENQHRRHRGAAECILCQGEGSHGIPP